MNAVKKTSEYTISKRRDGRFSVKDKRNKPVNGDEKVKILLAEELITLSAAAPVAEPEVEAPADEEVVVEEAVAEDAEPATEEADKEKPAE